MMPIYGNGFGYLDVLSQSVSAQAQQQKFIAKLTGNQEVPPINTTASGTAQFALSADGKALNYKLSVMKINRITLSEIHEGKRGERGPIVAKFVRFPTPTFPILINSTLSQGNITADKLIGPLHGKQISDLAKIMADGNAYVSINTVQNPFGQIRGQISVSPPPNAIEQYLNATLR
jgi:CHRD domain